MNDEAKSLRRARLLADPRELIRALGLEQGSKRQGKGVLVCCPVHGEKNASCSVVVGDDGTVACRCHACGWSGDALGLVAAVNQLDPHKDFPRVKELAAQLAGVQLEGRQERKQVAIYDYQDGAGQLLYQVVRFEPKDFRQRKPDGKGGWDWKLNGTARVLYRLPELLAAGPLEAVFVVEGEKDVDALRELGLVATCNPAGAGKWKAVADVARGVLRDRPVCIIADRDEPGRKHAREVAAALAGVADPVAVVEVVVGKDAAEAIALGATADDFRDLFSKAIVDPEREAIQAEQPDDLPPDVDPGPPDEPVARWKWSFAEDLFKPKPPPQWTIKDLGFAPGRPCLLSGPSSSAKTMLAQSLLLSLAAGRQLWSCFPALDRLLTVAHLDVDLGEDDLEFRYRRFISTFPGDPLTVEDLGVRFRRISYPQPGIDLMSDTARDQLKRELEGVDLCFGDALRGLASGDENSSEFRKCLDTAAAISNDTKVTFLFAHHTGNPTFGKGGKVIEEDKHGRGSSAIKDGAGTILRIGGSKQRGRKVWMHKPPGRTGVEWTDRYLMTITAPPTDDPSLEGFGLRVQLSKEEKRDAEQTQEQREAMTADEAAKVVLAADVDRRETFLAILREAKESGFKGGIDNLTRAASDSLKSRGRKGINLVAARELWSELEEERLVAAVGASKNRRLYLAPFAPQGTLIPSVDGGKKTDD